MNRREQGWVNQFIRAIAIPLTEAQEQAVKKVANDIFWDTLEEAAMMAEDNLEETSADDIRNLMDSSWPTKRQLCRQETLEEAAKICDDNGDTSSAEDIRNLLEDYEA